MYVIRKSDRVLPTKLLLNRTISLGLGITAIQFYVELLKVFHLLKISNGKGGFGVHSSVPNSHHDGPVCDHNRSEDSPCSMQGQTQIFQQDIKRYIVVGAFVYAQLFVGLVDTYLFTVVRTATRKESISDGWLGLCLQISLLTYNMVEILMVAYHGIFDGSSMLLAARATVRAISIEVICLFLREIQDKQDSDFVLYTKILLV